MRELKQDLRRLADSYGEPGFTLEQVRGRPPARRPRSRRVKVLAAVAVAAAFAIALPILLPLGPGGPDPAVAGLLRRFARIAAHAPAEPAPGPGQFVYTKVDEWTSFRFISGDETTTFAYSIPQTQVRWLGVDGSGRDETTTGDVTFASPQDEAAYRAWVAAGGPARDRWDPALEGNQTGVNRSAPGELFYRDTSTLPTDPDELGRLIEDREILSGPDGDWESFVLATDLIRDSYARPQLRAALYEFMADLPGIEMVGRTTDAIGRPGVVLSSTHDGMRYQVVFDMRTARILEEREDVVGESSIPQTNQGPTQWAYAAPGHLLYRSTYVTSAVVVDSDTEVPAA